MNGPYIVVFSKLYPYELTETSGSPASPTLLALLSRIQPPPLDPPVMSQLICIGSSRAVPSQRRNGDAHAYCCDPLNLPAAG